MFVGSLVVSRLDYCNAALAEVSMNHPRLFQSVMNNATRAVADLSRFENITLSLAGLHWLQAPERITFKLALLVYRCPYGTAPSHIASQLRRVADMPRWQRLRSSTTQRLDTRPSRLATVDNCAFPIATTRVWKSSPDDVTAAVSI
jgi:hypothetical protein